MSNPWTVAPDTDRIDLEWRTTDAQGAEAVRPFWLTVKRRLSVGESRAMVRSVTSVTQEVARVRGQAAAAPQAKLEWTEYSFARMEAYVVDWSLAHDPDPANRLAVGRKAYEALEPAVFELIDDALDAHEQGQAAGKLPTAGAAAPAAT